MSGNISNPAYQNYFKNLTIAGAGVTTTMTGNVYVGYTGGGTLTMSGGTLKGAGLHRSVYPQANDSITISNLTMGTALGDFAVMANATITQKAFTLPNGFSNIIEIRANGGNFTATGDWNLGNNPVWFDSVTTSGPTKYINMGSSALTAGNVSIGNGTTTSYNGYLKLGSSVNHSIVSLTRLTGNTANGASP